MDPRERGRGEVYDPAEDSALLAEAAVERVGPGDRVLDVGTGSGYVAQRVADAVGAEVVASDVNPHACRRARERGVETVLADLVAPFRENSFDVVLFNPPYLPTPPEQEWDDPLERALSGGPSGRAVIEPFLGTVGRVLRTDGTVLLALSSVTGVEAVTAFAAEQDLVVRETAAEDTFPFETISVLVITRRESRSQ